MQRLGTMGSATSLNTSSKSYQIVEDRNTDLPSQSRPMRRIPSDSSLRSNRTVQKSVRAMALINHSRQENSYIPQKEATASIRMISKVNRPDQSSVRERKFPTTVDERCVPDLGKIEQNPEEIRGSNPQIDPVNVSKVDSTQPSVSKEPNIAGVESSTSPFRNKFNLKLDLQDESDWVKVSIVVILKLRNVIIILRDSSIR